MFVCRGCLNPEEARGGRWISWNWSYTQLWATKRVLWMESGLSCNSSRCFRPQRHLSSPHPLVILFITIDFCPWKVMKYGTSRQRIHFSYYWIQREWSINEGLLLGERNVNGCLTCGIKSMVIFGLICKEGEEIPGTALTWHSLKCDSHFSPHLHLRV